MHELILLEIDWWCNSMYNNAYLLYSLKKEWYEIKVLIQIANNYKLIVIILQTSKAKIYEENEEVETCLLAFYEFIGIKLHSHTR
jgi:hypothetical protein